jgi:hypothetical protein
LAWLGRLGEFCRADYKLCLRKNLVLNRNGNTSYNCDDTAVDLSVFNKVVFYGAGAFLRDIMRTGSVVVPDEIWDKKADDINGNDVMRIGGIPVARPDLNLDFDKSKVAVIITIGTKSIVDEVRDILHGNGFDNVYLYRDISKTVDIFNMAK